MTLEEFEASLEVGTPPAGLDRLLDALWWVKKGQWNRAHQLAQDGHGREAAWVHAHLHRVEGDDANAGYWYRQAGAPFPEAGLDEEWREIARELLGEG